MSSASPIATSVYRQALAIESPTERACYLDKACGSDSSLRICVDELLAATYQEGSVEWRPAATAGQTEAYEKIVEISGMVVGPYKLLQQIGEGGMGTVFMAEQTRPVQRVVALKIIKAGMDTRQVIARFEAERQALALMDHPNIAKVLDAGSTDGGRPFFVMELVKGIPITRYCDEHHVAPRERLELFVPVCRAVQHAHQKGIIHRDLKPSNVIVALYDGQPVPKIIDFGVVKATGSKLTDRTMFTEFGAIVGTLEYMSPEQAEMNQLDVDTRSDIYSLGVLLYELLTGTTPLDRKRLKESALYELLRVIREEEPPIPSTRINTNVDLPSVAANRGIEPAKLCAIVRGELDWIVMKALEKDRNRRYETANDLLRDIERYLADEPVQACPPSAAYRFRKYARRHRMALATSAIVAASLLMATTVSVEQATLARRAEALAQTRLIKEQEAHEQAITEAVKATTISKLLQQVLQSANPDTARGADYTVRQLLDEFSANLQDQLKNQPDAEAAIRSTIGNAYRRLGLAEKAHPHLQAALELRLQLFGPDHAEVAQSQLDYAWNLYESGDLTGAESRARAALAIHRKLGLHNDTTIEILSDLQHFLNQEKKYPAANEVAKEALAAIGDQRDKNPEAANILHRMASAAIGEGDAARAEGLAREAVALHRKLHGEGHPETAWGLYVLALSLQQQQKLDEAEACYREALLIFRKHFDDSQTAVKAVVSGLSDVLRTKGDDEGLRQLEDDLAKRKARSNKESIQMDR